MPETIPKRQEFADVSADVELARKRLKSKGIQARKLADHADRT